MTVEPWGTRYYARVKDGGVTGAECVVCGRRLTRGIGVSVACSPTLGTFVNATIVGTPQGDEVEASRYFVGPDCARDVRAAHPESIG